MDDQLDLFDPIAEGWWECRSGSSVVLIRADNGAEARQKAEAALHELGVLPGDRPGLHESFKRMCEFARRGRR